MRNYATQQTRTLLRRLAYQWARTTKRGDADSIHDLRVAIRRFSQCLRVFAPFLPRKKASRIRQELKIVMGLTAEVRNRDIAIMLAGQAGVAPDSDLVVNLARSRKHAAQAVKGVLRRYSRRDFSRKWRVQLEL